MSIYSNLLAIDCTPTSIGRRARLPLTIAGLLLTAQARAMRLADSMTETLREEIEQRRQAQEQVKEALEVKAEFLSVVSHELRTPLTAIRGGEHCES